VITDQHFTQRQRFARLISAVLDRPSLLGVALDEGTAILTGSRSFEVIGNGAAIVVDARHAQVRAVREGEQHSAAGIRMSVLRAGDRFDWRRGRKLSPVTVSAPVNDAISHVVPENVY
jgi:cyanophycinase